MDFNLSGGTQVMGFISPFDTNDTYAVIDPLYGIDGFRNVVDLSALNAIPNARRRAGMVVGVSGGTEYYKLKDVTWSGITADWKEFTLGGGEVNTASSVGVSNEVFDQKVGSDLQFRTLSAGTNVTITSGATTLTINSSGGGADGNGIYGGSGSLPSKVDINTNSFDIEMTGAGGFYTTNPSASWSIGQGLSPAFQMYQVVTTHDVGHYIIQQKQDLSSNVIGQRILSNSVKTGSATLYGINTVLSGTHSGGTNVGMHISVTNALNNYGLIVQNGSVGIGTTTPTEQLDVIGNSKISGTLNLGNIGSGTSLTNLGIDSSGNVVSGTTGGGSGEVNTASNVGSGNGVFDQKVGSDLQFRTLSAGTNVTITSGSTTLTINSSGGGIFDVSNSGGTVPSSFDYTLTDSIQQTAANSYIKHEDREFAMVGTALGDRSYSISRSLANTSGNGSVFMLNNAGLTDNDRIDFLLQNYSGGASSKTELNFRRSNIGAGSGGSWIDFIMQSGINQNLYFNYNTNGSTPYGDVIVQNGNFVIKNLGTGTSITNIGVDSSGTLVSGTTGGSSDGNGIYDGSGSLTTGTTIASGGYDLNITGTGKFGVSGDIQFLSTAALESDTIKIVQSTGTTGTTGGIITFDGQTGGLFAITDDKDGQLFGVADVSGNDIMYADADWLIKMGNPFQLSGSPFELKYDNVSGNTTLSTNAINVNLNVQNITSTGVTSNIDVTKSIIKISTTTSADLLTLPDGVEGQVISIIYVAETAGADDVTITPTNLLGYTTIFLTLIGTGCELYFTDGSWVVKSQNNVTLS